MEEMFAQCLTLLPNWGHLALLSLPVLCLLAAALLPFPVFFGLVCGQRGRKGMHERCAGQLGGLACLLGWICLICLAISLVWCTFVRPQMQDMPTLIRYSLNYGAAILAVGLVLVSLARLFREGLRQKTVLHVLLWLVAGLVLVCMLFVGLLGGLVFVQDSVEFGQCPMDAVNTRFIVTFVLLLAFGLAAAGCLGLIWLLLRRNIDDYGRDYYGFAAKWCARWAAVGGWAAAAVGVLLGIASDSTGTGAVGMGFFLVPLLAASIVWTTVSASSMPMRHKIGMVACIFLLALSLAGAGMSFV